MMTNTILLSICTECTWQIIPMLLGMFALGYLFWFLFNKTAYQTLINGLQTEVGDWKEKSNQFEMDMNSAKYERDKTNTELTGLKARHSDLELKLKVMEEKLNNDNDADK